jgi:hypothetical protein
MKFEGSNIQMAENVTKEVLNVVLQSASLVGQTPTSVFTSLYA